MNLKVDPARLTDYQEATGFFIRAEHNGAFGTYDIAQLDKASLVEWLSQYNNAVNVVLELLAHPRSP